MLAASLSIGLDIGDGQWEEPCHFDVWRVFDKRWHADEVLDGV